MNSHRLVCLSLMLLAFIGQASAATVVVFDFESIVIPNGGNRIDYSGPQSFSEDGLTMTVRHENNAIFSLNRRTGLLFTTDFDFQAISAFNDFESRFDPGAFIVDFDMPINSISVGMGDFGVEADELLIQAFAGPDGTGTLLGEGTGFVPALTSWESDTVQVVANNIRSVRMIGGSPNIPNSVFYDNITVTVAAVPEPGVFPLAMTFLLLGCGRRGSKRTS